MKTLEIQPVDNNALQLLEKLSEMGIIRIFNRSKSDSKQKLIEILEDLDPEKSPLTMEEIQKEVDIVREERYQQKLREDCS
jgi:hypothetical protein